MYLVGFFFEDPFADSLTEVCPPLLCSDWAATVDDDADEEREEVEFCRWMLLRGMYMRETSSVLGVFCSPLLVGYHPRRVPDCTLGGGATAVIGGGGGSLSSRFSG